MINDLPICAEQLPALERILLDEPVVPTEGFRRFEEHKHTCLPLFPANASYFSCRRWDAMISSRIASSPRVIFQLG